MLFKDPLKPVHKCPLHVSETTREYDAYAEVCKNMVGNVASFMQNTILYMVHGTKSWTECQEVHTYQFADVDWGAQMRFKHTHTHPYVYEYVNTYLE